MEPLLGATKAKGAGADLIKDSDVTTFMADVVEGKTISTWTFAKSQKAKNLERLPQATLQVEAGTGYLELRGVMLECDVALIRDLAAVTAIGMALGLRYAEAGGPVGPSAEREAAVAKQAPKRIGLRFHPTRVVSWDHRKLAGGY